MLSDLHGPAKTYTTGLGRDNIHLSADGAQEALSIPVSRLKAQGF